MKLYEWMGKELFTVYSISVPKGRVAYNLEEVVQIAEEIKGPLVLKAQVLSGKRGKSGGIKFASGPVEAKERARELFNADVQGLSVKELLIEERLQIEREFFLAITIDCALKKAVLLASTEGGMDIEEIPRENLVKVIIDRDVGINPYLAREISRKIGFTGKMLSQTTDIITQLYRLFIEKDAELVEINPLALCNSNLIAADAKIVIDDEALYRQRGLPYVEERLELEKQAHALGLSYVQLEGNIAVMANGAGTTMATLDMLQYYGGSPANFLDAGGGANMETMVKALEILLASRPKVILINIFAGITRCDEVAGALIKIKQSKGIPVPVVVRLIGTNEEEGVRILKEHGVETCRVMQEAAVKAVELAKQ